MIPQLHSNARARQCAYHNSVDNKNLLEELMEHEQLSARSRIAHALYGRVDGRVYKELELTSPRRRKNSPPECSVLTPNIDTNVINSTYHQPKVITQVVIEGSDSRRVSSPTVVAQLINKRIIESRNLFLRTAGKVKPYLVVTEHTSPRGGRPPELPELPRQPLCRGTTAPKPDNSASSARADGGGGSARDASSSTTPRRGGGGGGGEAPDLAIALQSSVRISPSGGGKSSRLTSPRAIVTTTTTSSSSKGGVPSADLAVQQDKRKAANVSPTNPDAADRVKKVTEQN